ncbi:MAG: DUF2148 domain-containing protein [Thermoplasmata archaeon]|nr:DUF2148 domain-containing protein [Thermoplasmata archaeon]
MTEDALLTVAKLMELAARTAPKAAGKDFIEIRVLLGGEKDSVGKEMLRIGEKNNSAGFLRDGQNVLDAQVLVLIGILKHPGIGTDCRACGYQSCKEFNRAEANGIFRGPNCVHRIADLGIAVGSAVKTASLHDVDNRIMYRAGNATRSLGLMKSNVVYGIPLSATGKNIFFDRKPI